MVLEFIMFLITLKIFVNVTILGQMLLIFTYCLNPNMNNPLFFSQFISNLISSFLSTFI